MQDHQAVLMAVSEYFKGVFSGEVDRLRAVFHPRAALFAEIRGEAYYKPLEEYLDVVAHRKSPEALGEPFLMKPISVEVTHNMAFAKVHCPMLGYNYYDYLSFVRQDGRWIIVNKLFTDVPLAAPAHA